MISEFSLLNYLLYIYFGKLFCYLFILLLIYLAYWETRVHTWQPTYQYLYILFCYSLVKLLSYIDKTCFILIINYLILIISCLYICKFILLYIYRYSWNYQSTIKYFFYQIIKSSRYNLIMNFWEIT